MIRALIVSLFLLLALAGTVAAQRQLTTTMTITEVPLLRTRIKLVQPGGEQKVIRLRATSRANRLANTESVNQAIRDLQSDGWVQESTCGPNVSMHQSITGVTRYVFVRRAS